MIPVKVPMEHRAATEHGRRPSPFTTTGLRLLSLDGGGLRGLSSLMNLQQLMATIDPELPRSRAITWA
jgi:hypothetical protein